MHYTSVYEKNRACLKLLLLQRISYEAQRELFCKNNNYVILEHG